MDPDAIAAKAGLESGRFTTHEGLISFTEMGRYLEACVVATGDETFALRLGLSEGPGALKTLGFLVMNTASVRGALTTLAHYVHQVAGMIEIEENDQLACFEYSFFYPTLKGAEHITDAAIGLSLVLLRSLCGPAWLPSELRLARALPKNPRRWKRLVGAPVYFGAERNLIAFQTRWLDQPVEHADPQLRRILIDQLVELEARSSSSNVDRIGAITRSCILASAASLPKVANRLAMSPTTLKRRLAAAGTSFSELGDKVRFDMACQLLRDSNATVAQIAEVLGYSHTSTFSRAFSRWAKTSPRRWRQQA